MGAGSPTVIASLLAEPTEPRRIYDACYIICLLSLPKVEMSGLGKFCRVVGKECLK